MNTIEAVKADLTYIFKNFESINTAYIKDITGLIPDSSYESRSKFSFFIDNFNNFGNFLQDSDLSEIKHNIKEIRLTLDQIIETTINDKDNATLILHKINKLPNIRKFKFFSSEKVTLENLITLSEEVSNFLNLLQIHDLNDFFKELSNDEIKKCREFLIEFYNMENSTSPKNSTKIIEINDYFKNLLQHKKSNEIDENIEKASQKLTTLKTKIGIDSTSKLVEAFNMEANAIDPKISTLSSIIISIFIALILLFIFLLIITFNGIDFSFPSNLYFYHFYISFFLIVTGLLTYLIKERTRLVKHQHYCKITSLEIIALSEYIAQIDSNDKAEDLIIYLADRYFKGPNLSTETASESFDIHLISSKLSELTKIIENIKSINK